MAHTRRPQHPNAALTPTQRLKMVRLVGDGWSVAAAAQRFQVDDKTTRQVGRPLPLRGRSGHGGPIEPALSQPEAHPRAATTA